MSTIFQASSFASAFPSSLELRAGSLWLKRKTGPFSTEERSIRLSKIREVEIDYGFFYATITIHYIGSKVPLVSERHPKSQVEPFKAALEQARRQHPAVEIE